MRYQRTASPELYPARAWRAELYQNVGAGWELAASRDFLGFGSGVRIDGVPHVVAMQSVAPQRQRAEKALAAFHRQKDRFSAELKEMNRPLRLAPTILRFGDPPSVAIPCASEGLKGIAN